MEGTQICFLVAGNLDGGDSRGGCRELGEDGGIAAHGDDAGAHCEGDFDGGAAEGAGCGRYDDRFAGLECNVAEAAVGDYEAGKGQFWDVLQRLMDLVPNTMSG